MAKKKKKKKKSLLKSKDAKLVAMHVDMMKKAEAKEKARVTNEKAKAAREQVKAKEAKAKANGTATAASPGVFGAFGSTITFQVKDPYNEKDNRSIKVPTKIERQSRARWTTYNLLGRKPMKSYEGPDSRSIMLSITLDADQGINPRKTFDSLVTAAEQGTIEYLVIGGKLLGRYYIESMGDTWERFFQGGGVTKATGKITFAEYA